MISERESSRLDDICSGVGEHFVDYIVIVRGASGRIAWRSSDPTWAEGATRQYFNFVQMGNQFDAMGEFQRRIE